jgi:hypothetical protein
MSYVLETMKTDQKTLMTWQPLVASLEFTLRNAQQAWTVQTHSRQWEFGPYVQAQYIDGEIHAEITSNNFLRPGLSTHDEQRLRFLGWQRPFGLDHPNWFKVVPHTLQGHEDLAKIWVRTLIEVYGMDSHWRFTVAPLSIDFIRAWRSEMMPSRALSTFKLLNTKGITQPQVRQLRAKRAEEKQRAVAIADEVSVLLTRAKKLGLAGTDLIRLAQCEGSKESIKAITALVYAGPGAAGISVAKADVDELELYRTIELDEFEGLEFYERKSDFDYDYTGSDNTSPR